LVAAFCSVVIGCISFFLRQQLFFQWTSAFFIFFVLIAATLTMKKSKRFISFLVIIAILSFVFNITDIMLGNMVSQFCSKLFLAVFCVVLIICFGKDILKKTTVTNDIIFGAICIYLLIAISYGLLYNMINIIDPHSFYMLTSGVRKLPTEFDFFYFSFTTLTTVGYGDVAIVTSYAKAAVVMESITGIFYLAILVSQLVSKHSK